MEPHGSFVIEVESLSVDWIIGTAGTAGALILLVAAVVVSRRFTHRVTPTRPAE